MPPPKQQNRITGNLFPVAGEDQRGAFRTHQMAQRAARQAVAGKGRVLDLDQPVEVAFTRPAHHNRHVVSLGCEGAPNSSLGAACGWPSSAQAWFRQGARIEADLRRPSNCPGESDMETKWKPLPPEP